MEIIELYNVCKPSYLTNIDFGRLFRTIMAVIIGLADDLCGIYDLPLSELTVRANLELQIKKKKKHFSIVRNCKWHKKKQGISKLLQRTQDIQYLNKRGWGQ